MPALKTRTNILKREKDAVNQILATIERAQEDGSWLERDAFAPILTIGLRFAEVTPADLANSKNIGRSAVSKWKSGEVVPTQPTRETVILWIVNALIARRDKIAADLGELLLEFNEPGIEDDDPLVSDVEHDNVLESTG